MISWLRDIVIFVTAVSFLEWVIPEGTFEKYIKLIVSILVLSLIISPLGKGKEISVLAEIPSHAFSVEEKKEIYEESGEKVREMQTYQLSTIIKKKMEIEVTELLSSKFSGISRTDVEVYIHNESLLNENTIPYTLTITLDEKERKAEVVQLLGSQLGIEKALIHFK